MTMKKSYLISVLAILAACTSPGRGDSSPDKTIFQEGGSWNEFIDNRADAVMVYGLRGNPSDRNKNIKGLEESINSWKERGYTTYFMTGIAWGSYADYFTGKWDGEWHLDEAQVTMQGDTLWHGRLVPYIVPSKNYLEYFKECQIKPVIDAGVDAIFLEEPEFWAHSGYSDSFKQEWMDYYRTPWRPQDESPEATYLSSKLKYYLYYRALDEAFSYAKEYGKSLGREIRCYVPTHSLLNYSQWRIVSPEASLASLPCVDGYIAQVWTGTSREPDYFNGVYKERVFETAYLEYGCMASMTRPTGRRVWFLTDPIEDRSRDWVDYKRNYQATFTAQLLYPEIADYEIMPWPSRIYRGYYNKSGDSAEKIRIPKDYSSMMQVMINSAHEVPVSRSRVNGSHGISVLMGNSLMFQRFPIHEGYEDPQLSNFYGLAMPLVKRGVPVEISHIENLGYPKALKDVKVLLMTYSNMKPLDPEAHTHIADWVARGGHLIYCGTDADPFQTVSEWWNSGDNHYATPSAHLFEKMGLDAGAGDGTYSYGKGSVRVIRRDPKEFVMNEGGDSVLLDAVREAYGPLEEKNNFILDRGAYKLVAVLDEGVSDEPLKLEGRFIDLYDPALSVCTGLEVASGTQRFLYDVSKAPKAPCILAAASRAYDIRKGRRSFSYVCKSPSETVNVTRVLLPARPEKVIVNGSPAEFEWDGESRTCIFRHDNDPDGVKIEIEW